MKTILIVDDSKFSRSLLRVALIKEAYRVVETDGPDEAFEFIRNHKPDLIISDLKMPGLKDGLDFLMVLSMQLDKVPVLVCSADAAARDAVSDYALDYLGFMSKPIEKNLLIHCVKTLLDSAANAEGVVRFNFTPKHR